MSDEKYKKAKKTDEKISTIIMNVVGVSLWVGLILITFLSIKIILYLKKFFI